MRRTITKLLELEITFVILDVEIRVYNTFPPIDDDGKKNATTNKINYRKEGGIKRTPKLLEKLDINHIKSEPNHIRELNIPAN